MDDITWYRIQPGMLKTAIASGRYRKWWIAEQVGVHKTTLRRWLSGRIASMTNAHAERLSETLGISIGEFAERL